MLTVETGEGLVDADAYDSLDDVTNYQVGRADYDAWIAMSVEQQEAAVREATTYLDGTYTWPGSIRYTTQARSWPRYGGYDAEGRLIPSDVVPKPVKDACAFLAGKATGTSLQPEQSGASVKSKSVGPSGVSITYGDASQGSTTKRRWPEVDTILRGLTRSSASGLGGTLVRWS